MLSERAGTGKCFVRTTISSVVLIACTGCGSTLYSIHASTAQQRLAEAKELGAEDLAPYEFHAAHAHLEKAETEAAEADFGDAITLAEQSAEYSARAIELSRVARRGATP